MSGEMGGSGGKDLQVIGLDAIAQGITLTLSELKELGMDSMAGSGRGFEKLALSGMQLGHEGLTSAFKSFCERWEWGVRDLVIEGNLFAQNVGLSAGTLHETDQYVEGALKIGVNSLMGNPYASEDERATWPAVRQQTARPSHGRTTARATAPPTRTRLAGSPASSTRISTC